MIEKYLKERLLQAEQLLKRWEKSFRHDLNGGLRNACECKDNCDCLRDDTQAWLDVTTIDESSAANDLINYCPGCGADRCEFKMIESGWECYRCELKIIMIIQD